MPEHEREEKAKSDAAGLSAHVSTRVGLPVALARWLRTVRHFSGRQLMYRALKPLRRRIALRRLSVDQCQRNESIRARLFLPDPFERFRPRDRWVEEEGALTLLNRKAGFCSWFPPDQSPLWVFQLHYFNYLGSWMDPKTGWRFLRAWVKDVPVGHPIAWHPFPTSQRICNWVWWFSSIGESGGNHGAWDECLRSLFLQLCWLEDNVEYDLKGNHLLANAKGLVVGGLFFGREESVDRGLRILSDELPVQVLDDGGHYERSPMYHALVLEDLVVAAAALTAAGRALSPLHLDAIMRMADWYRRISAIGETPLLNDSVCGEALPLEAFQEVVETLFARPLPPVGCEPFHLGASGLVFLKGDPFAVLFDCGELGPAEQPGHAHSDLLSVHLWVFGEAVLTDSGVDEYDGSAYRPYFRSAFAHNAPIIDRSDPAELWKTFRLGRRPSPENVAVDLCVARAAAAHNGYQHLAVEVNRTVCLEGGGRAAVIADRVRCRDPRHLLVRFHLAPGCAAEPDSSAGALLHLPSGRRMSFRCAVTEGGGEPILLSERSLYSPQFNELQDRPMLSLNIPLTAGTNVVRYEWRMDPGPVSSNS